MPKLLTAIDSIYKDCFRLQRGERLLVLADPDYFNLAQAFYQRALKKGAMPFLSVIPEADLHHPTHLTAFTAYLTRFDAAILLTKRSLSHTPFRRRACRQGTRIASLPAITQEALIRNMDGQYKATIDLSRKIADILTIGRTGHLTTPSGTDLRFSLKRMKGHADTGQLHEAGSFGNLPFGEAAAAPVELSSEGLLVIDGSISQIGKLNKPIRMTVQGGYAVRISGGEQVHLLRRLLKPHGRDGRLIAEIGIGTNAKAQFSGLTLEDEKTLGTAHVALGNNLSFGGKNDVDIHLDGVLREPSLSIDNKIILKDGQIAL